ncbi:MAG: hypothetical protein K2P45_12545, partial [Eubacterium sp.]|nr:hypothetical protein [Eubacterium sp.]
PYLYLSISLIMLAFLSACLLSPFRHRFLLWLFSSDISSVTVNPSVYPNIFVEIPGKDNIFVELKELW